MSNTALGYAIVTSVVVIAVIVYTVIKLRKQVGKAEEEDRKKDHKP